MAMNFKSLSVVQLREKLGQLGLIQPPQSTQWQPIVASVNPSDPRKWLRPPPKPIVEIDTPPNTVLSNRFQLLMAAPQERSKQTEPTVTEPVSNSCHSKRFELRKAQKLKRARKIGSASIPTVPKRGVKPSLAPQFRLPPDDKTI
uniref:LEM domain-containing protein n=1 Tax=Panagrellus redivivus TaxID=6233 RepID=A0A7E4UPY1_PANRE